MKKPFFPSTCYNTPSKRAKGKGKGCVQPTLAKQISNSEGFYFTFLTPSNNEGSSPAHVSETEVVPLLQARRA